MMPQLFLVPSAGTEDPRYEWSTRLKADGSAGRTARLRVRSRLTVAHWHGDVELAARIVDFLVGYSVRHGQPYADGCVVLRLTADESLVIEVEDADPVLPGQLHEPLGPGLDLSWHMTQRHGVVVGKTLRVRLAAVDGPEDAA